MFKPGFSSLTLLEAIPRFAPTGLSPSVADLSRSLVVPLVNPLSLGATHGVAVAFLSCSY
jgi:hypothetical protein